MAYEQYSFFNSTDEDERSYGAEVFAEYFASFIDNGIFGGGDNLRAHCTGADRVVRVLPGSAWINGYYYALKADEEGAEYALETAPADAANDRIDSLVLRLDTSAATRSIRLKVIEGEPAASPAAPAPVREGAVYDLVLVSANTSVLQAAAVTDKRLENELCGLAGSHTHAASGIQAGTLGGKVQANAAAMAELDAAQVRSIRASDADLAAGTAVLPTGEVYLVYE